MAIFTEEDSRSHLLDFDDSHFERITIPHTNVSLPWHSFDDKAYEFVSTYRRRFKVPTSAAPHRTFVDFEGAMTASKVWINGTELGEYKGGYTPFSFDITPHLRPGRENVLVVELDSTERPDIPPFGYEIDYMTFGGIYREVSLRIVPDVYLDNIFARPKDVLSGHPSLDVDCFLAGNTANMQGLSIEVELRDGDRIIATVKRAISNAPAGSNQSVSATNIVGSVHTSSETLADPHRYTVSLSDLNGIQLWDLAKPQLYTVHVRLLRSGQPMDEDNRRIGFRHAEFTDHGFALNGKVMKLAVWTGIRRFRLSGKPCRNVCSDRTRRSCGKNSTAISCAHHIIRSRVIFSIAATRSASWYSKRFPAGNISAMKRGSRSPSITSAA